MRIELNNGQLILAQNLINWYKRGDSQIYVYSGPAGSGKTTVALYALELMNISLSNVIAVALSGKAVNVLANSGLPAQTIHSLIYTPSITVCRDELGNPIVKPDGSYKTKPTFVLKDRLPDNIKIIVVDELSMVSDEIMDDILSFGIPVIGMGDINQLPPIFGISSHMLRPNYFLTQIMRQAENDPIIRISQDILHNKPFTLGTYGKSRIVRKVPMKNNLLTDYDIILCARNTTRDYLNDTIRLDLQGKTREPCLGDKVICRQNNRDRVICGRFLSNGTVGNIDYIDRSSITKNKITIDFSPEYNPSEMFSDLDIDRQYIRMDYLDRKDYGMTSYEKFEYAYAITTHLSQGSQYQRVLYFDEPFGGGSEMIKKLRYTAVTRAVSSIDIVLGNY